MAGESTVYGGRAGSSGRVLFYLQRVNQAYRVGPPPTAGEPGPPGESFLGTQWANWIFRVCPQGSVCGGQPGPAGGSGRSLPAIPAPSGLPG